MNFETYLTQTIQNAVKEAVPKEFDDLKKTLMQLKNLQSRTTHTQTSTSKREIIRPKELAKMLGLSIQTIYRMYNEGQLPPKIKISSRAVGWLRSDIEDWLLQRKGKVSICFGLFIQKPIYLVRLQGHFTETTLKKNQQDVTDNSRNNSQ